MRTPEQTKGQTLRRSERFSDNFCAATQIARADARDLPIQYGREEADATHTGEVHLSTRVVWRQTPSALFRDRHTVRTNNVIFPRVCVCKKAYSKSHAELK